MEETRPSIRYGHCPGHTEVCYDDVGRYILSCGADGDVRTWDGFDDSDASSYQIGETVYSVFYKNQKFYTASNMNSVQAFTFPDGVSDGLVTRFTAPPTHISMNRSGSTLVAGASDFTIKIVDVISLNTNTLTGHEAPVLSVALHPKELFVASSSCDGTFRVWSVSTHSCLKTWQGLEKCSDISLVKSLCRLCFDQEGSNLLVPIEKEIIVYSTKNWNKVTTLTDPSITEFVSVLSFSPDWKVLAAGCYNGLILLFDWNKKKCIKTYKHDRAITSFAWDPKKNDAIFGDKQGQIALMENILPSQEKKAASSEVEKESNTVAENDIFGDMDDDDLLDGAIGPDNPEVDQGEISENEFNARLEGMLDGDEPQDGDTNLSDKEAESVPEKADVPYKEVPQTTPLQRAFQPASTPEHLTHRFMKWNTVGIIKQYNTESENTIDIEFHDTAIHHAMHLNNHTGYTMADLSREAVVLASPMGEESSESKLTCMHFASWDNGKEWSVPMPEGEEILAVTVGDGWIAAGTSNRLVRLFTLTGIQREIFSIPGPLVCLNAGQDQLMVVYHRGTGVPGDQCLGTDVYRVGQKKKCILKGDLLPLSAKSFLCWAGFSVEGTPFYMDSTGVVSMLNRSFGNSWTQVCHTKNHAQGKSDHYWIIGVVESQQQIRCILCKGSRFPPTLPRPVMGRLPLQLPLCELTTEKSLYEEKLWRMQFFQNTIDFNVSNGEEFDQCIKEESMKSSKEELMKLFALSVRSDRECRALDICEMMPDQHTLQLAIKYASRLKRMQLAQRISELARERAVEEIERRRTQSRQNYNGMADDDEESEEEQVEVVQPVQPRSFKITKKGQSSSQNGRVNDMRQKRPVEKEKEKEKEKENDVEEEKDNVLEKDDTERQESEEEVDNDNDNDDVDEEMADDSEKIEMNGNSQNGSSDALVEEFLSSSGKSAISSPKGFPSSGRAINPFKVNSQQKSLSVMKGTQVFDSMMKSKSSKTSLFPGNDEAKPGNLKSQMKLFSTNNVNSNKNTKPTKVKPKNPSIKSGFPAWFKENKQELEEENPELSEEDIKKLGTDKYKELPKDEKEVWEKKLKDEPNESKKRKRTDKDDSKNAADGSKENKKTKILPTSTNSKLANFMFKKD